MLLFLDCFIFWQLLCFLWGFLKIPLVVTWKTFNILDNYYDACEVFEHVFKNAFNCILKTIKDNFYDACEVFKKCLLVVSWGPSRIWMVRIRNSKCLWQVPKFIFTIDPTLLYKMLFSVLENLRQFNMCCWLQFIYYVNAFVLHTLQNI